MVPVKATRVTCHIWTNCATYLVHFFSYIAWEPKAYQAIFIVPTWDPPGSCWPQVGPMLAPWTLLSEYHIQTVFAHILICAGSLGSSHEGSGRHPRQHGGGRGRRFSKFMANSHCVCSLLRPSFCELIVNVMGHIDAEFRAAVIRHLAAIPA